MQLTDIDRTEQIDQEYLDKPLVEGIRYQITDSRVHIACDHTLYTDVYLNTCLDRKSLLERYQDILRQAKESGVSISYTRHFRRIINERWEEYLQQKERQRTLFARIVVQAAVVSKRGIHMGCRDDRELEKLHELCREYEPLQRRSNILSIMEGISSQLRKLEDNIGEYDRVFL